MHLLILAAGTEVPAVAMPHWLNVVLMVLGAVVPLASGIVAFVNGYIRAAKGRGEKVPTWLLALGAALNVVALNPDKTVEQGKAIAAKKDEVTP